MIFCAKNEDGIPSWELILRMEKIVTRRMKPMPIDKEFAVQPGRGKYAVCRARVTDCQLSKVHYHVYAHNKELFKDTDEYKKHEAQCEGFKTWNGLMRWFIDHKIPFEDTFRIEFNILKIDGEKP